MMGIATSLKFLHGQNHVFYIACMYGTCTCVL